MRLTQEQKDYFIHTISDLYDNDKLHEMNQYLQHGNTTTFMHCLTVAYVSYLLSLCLRFHFDRKGIIRGAMLHDFYLYDWHIPDKTHHLHGFYHPDFACKNAKKYYPISPIEEDIIKKHMWPLTLTHYPIYRESILVCFVDKICSLAEIFRIPMKARELRYITCSLRKIN